ncbi:MAG: SpoVA/SpoVAEb family sporulation membrane protein [Oscillospiraceae bacterium]|nr:SpoVA/SpoVAEb family sporulation membrane protein [Oscillospiraceae bacterium]
MKMTNAEYKKIADSQAPASRHLRNLVMAFMVGGAICVFGQALQNTLIALGQSKDNAAAFVSVALIFLGALLTGLHVFDNIAKTAGAGTLVPITGFANAVVSPAMEFKSEGLVLGLSSRMFIIAGPVLVFGISASALYGLVLVVVQAVKG